MSQARRDRAMSYRNQFKRPIAIAAARELPHRNPVVTAGLVVATAGALVVSPVLALGFVGLMLWQAWQPE